MVDTRRWLRCEDDDDDDRCGIMLVMVRTMQNDARIAQAERWMVGGGRCLFDGA